MGITSEQRENVFKIKQERQNLLKNIEAGDFFGHQDWFVKVFKDWLKNPEPWNGKLWVGEMAMYETNYNSLYILKEWPIYTFLKNAEKESFTRDGLAFVYDKNWDYFRISFYGLGRIIKKILPEIVDKTIDRKYKFRFIKNDLMDIIEHSKDRWIVLLAERSLGVLRSLIKEEGNK